jgi:hypothetical protein
MLAGEGLVGTSGMSLLSSTQFTVYAGRIRAFGRALHRSPLLPSVYAEEAASCEAASLQVQ